MKQLFKQLFNGLSFVLGLFLVVNMALAAPNENIVKKESGMIKTQKLTLTNDWDKTFPKSEKVNHKKVTFVNRYGITLAADLYEPKNAQGKLPALAVSGPFGAVKEQVSGFYAQTMAERGFLTLAFDPSYTGESGGEPRNVTSPDINTEDFMAAVDFFLCRIMSILIKSALSVFAVSAAWHSMLLRLIPVLKRFLLTLRTIIS